ncbi:acetyltransferase (GNAT) family protein [Planomicrobium soli]|uniref:Acetyltransferase (GNAT) family protein n=1 Tax=Planomicrobium soli TaxID=1176648 RepID=A0A2P8H426_9BACL|nr:GNAT family N-acetyltransferase [Planomicrobium soli]PSL40964.1 acetyltransferase (GNAT) family protein [Planomicrobium soli]
MKVRQALPEEFQEIYKQGFKEWAKGRQLDSYIKDNQKEEENGIRYILVNDQEQIIASLMMIQFRPTLYGIGSIVVNPVFRNQGFGKKLVRECLEKHPEAAFILYSEIEPGYYEKMGFRVISNELQQSSKAICMIRAEDDLFEQVLQEPIPGYF